MTYLKSGSLRLITTYIIVTVFDYLKITTDAQRLLNERSTHRFQSRSLLFPPTAPTRVQFIGGIGIPVEDLHFESVTSGYVLKAEYFLPETANELRQKIKPQTIHRRRKSVNETIMFDDDFDFSLLNTESNEAYDNKALNWSTKTINNLHQTMGDNSQSQYRVFYRWIVYKAIETILNKSSFNGHVCILRSICEHAAIPLNYKGGLLAEILHIILTPSMSRDKPSMSNHKNYIRAEISGRSGENCKKVYSRCKKSPLGIISAVFEI